MTTKCAARLLAGRFRLWRETIVLELTAFERDTPLWKKLERHLVLRLDEARRRNEADLNEIETAKLRGRVFELSALLKLANPVPAEDFSDAQAPETW